MSSFLNRVLALASPSLSGHPTAAHISKKLSYRKRPDGALAVLYDGSPIGKIAKTSEGQFYAYHSVVNHGSQNVLTRSTLAKAKEDMCFAQLLNLQFTSVSLRPRV